jgi:hypothetical protein
VTSVSVIKSAESADPAAALAARLAEPGVADALNTLLDHADLLAILVAGLDGLISRGDTITDALADGVSELRLAGEQTRLDTAKVVSSLRQVAVAAPPLLDKLPVLENLLGSDLADPRVIDVAGAMSRAAIRGAEQAQSADLRVTGLRSLLRALKDPDVSRALGFVLSIAKALGQELDNAH